MWFKWLPWKYVVRRIARANGFVDPISILSRVHGFAQPSEVAAPIELVRAGVVFHARGLMNTKAIQQNLDWIWPYWVQRQFDPEDVAFLPRAFSITHVNLTLRNWTAVGTPGCNAYPIVDPRGLVTPYYDGWSLDAWVLADDGACLLPPKLRAVSQRLLLQADGLSVRTEGAQDGLALSTETWVEPRDGDAVCRVSYRAITDRPAWLAIALRPANAEGVSFIHAACLNDDRRTWSVNGRNAVTLSDPVERHLVSDYYTGDVFLGILEREERVEGKCPVGLTTAAALYRLEPGVTRHIQAETPLSHDIESVPLFRSGSAVQSWNEATAGAARLRVPDPRFQFLYDAALRTLVLHSPRDAYPGPYTYKRFWFRDAAYIVNALLCAGLRDRAETVLDQFTHRQHISGFFKSQEGEWDSNGEVLWIFHRFVELTGKTLKSSWRRAAIRGGEWIVFKRLSDKTNGLHAGLMPAGFSAEHLGNNDFYYWDDFWSVAGLRALVALQVDDAEAKRTKRFEGAADALMAAIERSLEASHGIRRHPGFPASPYRRMDAGAIGSIVADYPLQILPPADPRIMATIEYLRKDCSIQGAFFQDMIHSGMNAYLTLQMAQVLLRAGDPEFVELVKAVARLASPTGQWPEAIHPHTGGGCMGDGQHVWAAAEWVIMLRNMFLREEGDELILGAGIPEDWLRGEEPLHFGPAPTPFGDVTVSVVRRDDGVRVSYTGQWRRVPTRIVMHAPGCPARTVSPEESGSVDLSPYSSDRRTSEFRETATTRAEDPS